MNNQNCTYMRCANSIGLFLAVLFIICFAWFYIRPMEQGLHLSLLSMSYFGFNGMNFASFISGLIQTYIWGYIIVGIWRLVGCCCKTNNN